MRAHAILLSEKGFALNQLADIFEINRDSVSQCPYTLKRLLKGRNYAWKLMRRSVRDKQNEQDFQTAKSASGQAACGGADSDFDLIYFDGAGFTLTPSVSYAWQRRVESLELASAHSARLNVLGFLNLNGAFESYVFEGAIDSAILIKCFDDSCQKMGKPALLVLDNALIQTSAAFEAQMMCE